MASGGARVDVLRMDDDVPKVAGCVGDAPSMIGDVDDVLRMDDDVPKVAGCVGNAPSMIGDVDDMLRMDDDALDAVGRATGEGTQWSGGWADSSCWGGWHQLRIAIDGEGEVAWRKRRGW